MLLPLMMLLGMVHAPADEGTARWSTVPHRVVARIAEERLGPQAATEVRRLLQGATLADVSTWADDVRASRPRTSNWHYVNIPVTDSTYRPREHCRTGCIVRAYASQVAILRDRRRSDTERADALRFLVHLVADVHSPMHAGDRGDRGGNDLVVWSRGRRTNLHAFWDSGILQAAQLSERVLEARVRTRVQGRDDLARLAGSGIVDWALESHALARAIAYGALPADYRLGAEYFAVAVPVVEERLARAAVRLAALLETLLARGS
jgi:hypothetical protein